VVATFRITPAGAGADDAVDEGGVGGDGDAAASSDGPCYKCVSMLGIEGCDHSAGGSPTGFVCAVDGMLSVNASGAPIYYHQVDGVATSTGRLPE
jgi:hypothetical protein